MSRTRTVFLAILAVLAFVGVSRFLNTSGQARYLLSLDDDQRRTVAGAVRALEARQGSLGGLYEVRILGVREGPPCPDGASGLRVDAQSALLGVIPVGRTRRYSCGALEPL